MNLIFRIRRFRQNFWLGLLVALPIFAAALLVRYLFGDALPGVPFITLTPAILLAALIGGVWVGLAVTVLSGIAAAYLFIPPIGSLQIGWAGAVIMALFVVTSGIQLYVIELINRALDQLEIERDRSAVMFQELQHRVANNMQFIAGLLHLQRRVIDANPALAGDILADTQHRFETMARIHRRLYEPAALAMPTTQYFQGLCTDVLQASGARNIVCVVEALAHELDIQRLVTLSLLVNEIITNSVKHAFADGRPGTISIRLDREAENYALTVADDGRGLPEGFSLDQSSGLGFGIMRGLVAQLNGELEFVSGVGTTTRVVFPV
jgi:two-component sensor histidine kinase